MASAAAAPAAASVGSAAPSVVSVSVPWARPMLRRRLPAQCRLIEVRGEDIWTGAEEDEPPPPAVEEPATSDHELAGQMASLAVAASASASPPPAAATAATGSPQKTPKKNNHAAAAASSASPATTSTACTPKSNGNCKHGPGESTTMASPASCASSLVVPPGHTLASITSQLLSEVASGRLTGLEFSSELGSKDRVMVHTAAEEAGLEHESLGFRPRRHLYVQRQPAEAKEASEADGAKEAGEADGDEKYQLSIVARVGHIYLEGPLIDRYGSEPHPLVDDACRANRAARDGVHYHATLVHGSLVERLRKERPPCLGAAKEPTGDDDAAGAYSFESELVDFFALRLTTPVREFGLGRATSGQHTAYYRVLQWAQLNDLRGELGLPPVDLHVTVGFKMQDVHGVAKNRWTLCEERRKK